MKAVPLAFIVVALYFAVGTPPVASGHTATHHADPDVRIDTFGSCVSATFYVSIESVPAGNWKETWRYSNEIAYGSGGGAWDEGSGSHGSRLVLLEDTHEHTVYNKCFPSGSHGWLSITVDLQWTDVDAGHHVEDFGCHWGHGTQTHCEAEI